MKKEGNEFTKNLKQEEKKETLPVTRASACN
jgi:hypothetical protein